MDFKSFFKKFDSKLDELDEKFYDENVDFYYTNLINSIILFSLRATDLEKLHGPCFDPLFERESEIDYAYIPVCFESIFRDGRLDISFKKDLLDFKQEVGFISVDIWNWDDINRHEVWRQIREKANETLDKLGIESRVYNNNFNDL